MEATAKAAKKTAQESKHTAFFVKRHWKGVLIVGGISFQLVMLLGNLADRKYSTWYPLMEWGWTQDDCTRQIEAMGMETITPGSLSKRPQNPLGGVEPED